MKKSLKRILSTVFVFALVTVIAVALTACHDKNSKKDSKLKITATSTMLVDAVKQIGKDKVEVNGIMGPGVDPHTYTSQPNDAKMIKASKLLVVSGINFEAQVLKSYEGLCEKEKIELLNVGDTLFEKYGELDPKTAEKDKLGFLPWFEDGKKEGNDPHFWNDIRLWKEVVGLITNKLVELDKTNKDFYEENNKNYQKELDDLIKWVEDKSKEVPEEERIVITGHDAFCYMERQFGYKIEAIQGVSTESEATPEDIQKTAEQAKELKVKAIFIESTIPEKTTKQVIEAAKKLGHDLKLVKEPLFSDALGTEKEGTDTYIKMYKHNIKIIIDNLK